MTTKSEVVRAMREAADRMERGIEWEVIFERLPDNHWSGAWSAIMDVDSWASLTNDLAGQLLIDWAALMLEEGVFE